jgi:hypothetical protein
MLGIWSRLLLISGRVRSLSVASIDSILISFIFEIGASLLL